MTAPCKRKIAVNDTRKLQIAMLVLRHLMHKEGVHLSENVAREINNIAKAIGVSAGELKEFARPLVQELVDECFGTKMDEAVGKAFSSK